MRSSADSDERFRQGGRDDTEPDPFLVRCTDAFESLEGRDAADVACGAGRNADFLVRSGFRVTAFDHSVEALRLASERVGSKPLETRRVDLEAPDVDLGAEAFDIVCVVRFLHRPLFPVLRRAVKRGGLVVYHTYTTENLRFDAGPRDPRFLLEPDELLREFAPWRVIRYEEEWSDRGTAALLARKP